MKLNEELVLPAETGFQICEFLKPNELATASATCKNWNSFFSDDYIWKRKLKETGIIKLEELKILLSAATFKDLYKQFATEQGFKTFFFKANLDENLYPVNIILPSMKNIARCVYCPDSSLSVAERITLQKRFLTRCGLSVYSSQHQFMIAQLLGEKFTSQPMKPILNADNVLNGGTEDPLEEALITICKGNKKLLESLRKINLNENCLFALFGSVFSLSGELYLTRADLAKMTSSIMPTNRETIYFTYCYQTKLECEDGTVLEYEQNHDINAKFSCAIEIGTNKCSLLSYNISVSKKLHPTALTIFNDEKLINSYIDPIINYVPQNNLSSRDY